MIEDESAPYDMSIHSNPSASAWTKFFREHNPECNIDDDVMFGWFANAMMAMHDHIYQTTQPEQTEQEPVAWMYDWNIKGEGEYGETRYDCLTRAEAITKRAITNIRPLYKSPPKREPLSDEDVLKIATKVCLEDMGMEMNPKDFKGTGVFELSRAIEKAHGITGGEE